MKTRKAIAKIFLDSGKSLTELQKDLSLPYGNTWRLVNEEHTGKINAEELWAFAKLFGVSMDALMRGEIVKLTGNKGISDPIIDALEELDHDVAETYRHRILSDLHEQRARAKKIESTGDPPSAKRRRHG